MGYTIETRKSKIRKIALYCWSQVFFMYFFVATAQSGNVIILINGELVTSGLLQINTSFSDSPIKYSTEYAPGILNINDRAWKIISNDSLGRFNLTFQHQTFKREKSNITFYEVDLSKSLLGMRYVIINIYDFKKKKYRRWYGPYTDKNYIAEISYPGSPLLVRYN